MKVGDTVVTLPGFEDTVMPLYKGEVTEMGPSSVTVRIRCLPDGHKVQPHAEFDLVLAQHKLKVVEGDA